MTRNLRALATQPNTQLHFESTQVLRTISETKKITYPTPTLLMINAYSVYWMTSTIPDIHFSSNHPLGLAAQNLQLATLARRAGNDTEATFHEISKA
jgi:hypothetical protein